MNLILMLWVCTVYAMETMEPESYVSFEDVSESQLESLIKAKGKSNCTCVGCSVKDERLLLRLARVFQFHAELSKFCNFHVFKVV